MEFEPHVIKIRPEFKCNEIKTWFKESNVCKVNKNSTQKNNSIKIREKT